MPRIVYLDGDYLLADEASVSIFDRGFLMADAVYRRTQLGRRYDRYLRTLHEFTDNVSRAITMSTSSAMIDRV